VVTQLREAAADSGSKALLPPGAVVTPIPLSPTSIVEQGKPAPSLLSVIPTIQQDTPTYRVLRQIDPFTNNAAVVTYPDPKPTSVITLEEVDGSLKVVAHLSEAVNRFWLMDDSNLAGFITRQLYWGILSKLEEQVINGDGLLGNFTGMLATSGVQQQAFATDPLTTLRAAATKLEVLGYEASAFAVAAADWLAITTTRNASGLFDVGGPIDAAAQSAWGIPVVVTPHLAAGQALGFDAGSVLLRYGTGGVLVDWDQSATLFEQNQTRARVEGRFGFDVLRPAGVVVADLTAL
jgi:HK97 family phage major capsid protein